MILGLVVQFLVERLREAGFIAKGAACRAGNSLIGGKNFPVRRGEIPCSGQTISARAAIAIPATYCFGGRFVSLGDASGAQMQKIPSEQGFPWQEIATWRTRRL
jgi:hypothetical protein